MFKAAKALSRTGLFLVFFCASAEAMRQLWQDRYLPVTLLYLAGLAGAWAALEAGNIEQRRILDLIYAQFFGAVCANLFFALLMCTVSGALTGKVLWIFFLLTVLEVSLGMLWAAVFFFFYLKGRSCQQALFVYGEREDPGETVRKNNRMNGYFRITGCVHFREGVEVIDRMMDQYAAVYLGDIPSEVRNQIMKLCICRDRECYSIPKISDIYIQNADILRLYDKVLFHCREGRLTREQEIQKRAADILCALVLLILAAPLMAVIAAAVWIEDRGPVIYRQRRITRGGREFDMLKFRSMHVDAERDGARLASVNDTRITRVGRVIRNLHFDELPQLINVLKGEMSMVGPRPERREFIEEYAQIIPEFAERLKVRGGLTGYAQIYGKYNTEPEDKIKYDLIYIYHYSLHLDLRLLLLTVRILFQKENTEGVADGQKSAAGRQMTDTERKTMERKTTERTK